jgi:predicted nucleic acid-binding protein
MILVDTSVWANHLRATEPRLRALLENRLVVLHPFVLGELACGNLPKRAGTIAAFEKLPVAAIASEQEVRHLLDSRRLWGSGLGWIDLHLLASAVVGQLRLWTADRAMASAASSLGIAFPEGSSRQLLT